MYKTLKKMELAGHSDATREQCDGKSFAPYLLGQPFEPRQWISTQLNLEAVRDVFQQ